MMEKQTKPLLIEVPKAENKMTEEELYAFANEILNEMDN
jgi:hypothetical protein